MISVGVACNDPNSGRFSGQAPAFDFALDCEETLVGLVGPETIVSKGNGFFTVAGVVYPHQGNTHWVGNWCWDTFDLSIDDARRLLKQLLQAGFEAEDLSDDGGPFADLIAEHEAKTGGARV